MPRTPLPWGQISPFLTPRVTEKFRVKVARQADQDACWPWTGARNQCGYGMFYVSGISQVNRASIPAIRIAYYLAHGEMRDDRFVCHTCDNRGCCNPAHLWLGTHRDNLRDMWRKGRGVTWNKGMKFGPRKVAA